MNGAYGKLETKIRQKEAEIADLQHQIDAAKEYVRAMREALQVFSRDSGTSDTPEGALRAGGSVAKAHAFLERKGAVQHISLIVPATGKPNNPKNRAALAGQLSSYARRGEIFTRPAPNTFGLLVWGTESADTKKQGSETPASE